MSTIVLEVDITSHINPACGDNIFRPIAGTHTMLQHGFVKVKYA